LLLLLLVPVVISRADSGVCSQDAGDLESLLCCCCCSVVISPRVKTWGVCSRIAVTPVFVAACSCR
jgi:hypothetical protein